MLSARWLRWHLLAAILMSLAWAGALLLQQQHREQQGIDQDQQALDRAESQLLDRFADMVNDLRFVASAHELHRVLTDRSDSAVDGVAALFEALLRDKHGYISARLFDDEGRMLARVDRRGDQLRRLPPATLARNDGQDLFDAARVLQPRTVYLARLALEVDNGTLALPHRPLLRAAVPLRIPGRPAMVLVLDRDAAPLLDGVVRQMNLPGAQAMIVDDLGYWLHHPEASQRWGAQLGAGTSLARRYPETWVAIQGARGERRDDSGTWSYRPLRPAPTISGIAGPIAAHGLWLLVHRPKQVLWLPQRVVDDPRFWIVQLLMLIFSGLLAQQRSRHHHWRRQQQQALQQVEAGAQAQRDMRERVYRLGLSLQTATTLHRFGDVLLSELARVLPLSVGALYLSDGRWLRAIAGYGLPDDVTLRQFKSGEGLLSEALASQQRITLAKLPPDYLEVRSALGQAPPSQLLLVPLWLRADKLGVLELGLTQPLSVIAEQTLRQCLPLIALHLANLRQRPDTDETPSDKTPTAAVQA